MSKFFAGRVLIEAIAPIFGCMVMVWLLWNVETRFMPVVSDFKITNAVLGSNGLTAIGTINRKRSCELVNLAVVKVRNGVPTVLLDSQKSDLFAPDSSLGEHAWGPITFPLNKVVLMDDDTIRITGLHRCHSLWLKQTEYMNQKWSDLKTIVMTSPYSPSKVESSTKYFIRVAPLNQRQ